VPYNGEDNNDYVDGEVVQHIEYVPFEPVGKNGHYKGVALSYPHGTDLEAIALMNLDYTPLLKTDNSTFASE